MSFRLPLIPTLIVAIAVATMIALGVWQIERAREKEALLARYAAAQNLPPVAYPTIPTRTENLPLFRRAVASCVGPTTAPRATAGRNRSGESGYAHVVSCGTGAEGPGLHVELGWSRDPNAKFTYRGGAVEGVIAPDSRTGMRLVAASPPAGLQASAAPSLETIPNNHLFYAVQWFLFAAMAAVIYLLAVRKRNKDAGGGGPRESNP